MGDYESKPASDPYRTPTSPLGTGGGMIPTSEEKNLAMLAHLTGMLGAILGGVLGPLGPAVIWMIKKDESAFVGQQAREALNFQLTLLIVYAICVVLALVTCGFGFILVLVPWVLALVFGILSCLAASKGEAYRYPLNIRLIN